MVAWQTIEVSIPAVAIWTPEDGILGALAPLGLAASVDTCLVVDLDPSGPAYPSESTLRSIVEDQPRRRDLSPERRGMAVLRNGGVAVVDAAPVIDALLAGWPHVVLRHPSQTSPVRLPGVRQVTVRSMLPGWMGDGVEADVWQATGLGRARVRGHVLPRPSAFTVSALASGQQPARSRWVRAWKAVWG